MDNRRILICGAGIAGPTLAYWLRAAGFTPTIVEQSPTLRSGGYVIDFWGLGYDIAGKMGLLPEISRIGYHMREMRVVNGRNERVAGFGTAIFDELTGGRFVTLARSDLSRLIFERITDHADILFGEQIVGIAPQDDGVEVTFERRDTRRFDLVIGADGLHSKVRELVFGTQDRFETALGYAAAAFEVDGYQPRDESVYVLYNRPGRMVARFALHDARTLFLFVFAIGPDDQPAPRVPEAQKAQLRRIYADARWECPRILDELDRAPTLYFDRVSQIRMDTWSRGRIALVGDAAFCPSLMAGQGSALAMTAAYVLAGELAQADGRHDEAFRAYEARLRPFIAAKQASAAHFAGLFAPKTRAGLFLRNQMLRAFGIPGLARLVIGRDLVDSLRLPAYHFAGAAS